MSVSKDKAEKIIDQILKDLDKIRLISESSSSRVSSMIDREWVFELKKKQFKLEKTSSILVSLAPGFALKLLGENKNSFLQNTLEENDYVVVYPFRNEGKGFVIGDINRDSQFERKLSMLMNHLMYLDDKKTDKLLGDDFFD